MKIGAVVDEDQQWSSMKITAVLTKITAVVDEDHSGG
jgi:hypothetical protein